jgi:hypothetical protein
MTESYGFPMAGPGCSTIAHYRVTDPANVDRVLQCPWPGRSKVMAHPTILQQAAQCT